VRGAVLFGVIAFIALLLQTAVLPLLTFGRATPDLLLIMCVYLGLRQHSVGGAVGAFFLGYLQDTFSGTTVGLNAFAMCLVFTIVYLTSRRLWVDNAISKVVVVFLAAVLKTTAILALVALFLTSEGVWLGLLQSLSIQAVLAALLSPPVFAILAQTHELMTAGEA
jgi:rod shape-determining protein MreD